MKKFLKFGKKIIALFIIVLLNVNTYATVNANDGSAFVTKAEFDTLVKNFNEAMNSYQSGLNAKIDDSISNYLGGLSNEQVIAQNNIYNAIQKSSDNGVVRWNGEFNIEETELTDKIEQIGEVLLVKMGETVESRIRIMSQTDSGYPGWPTKVGSTETKGKYYYVTDNYGIKEYWTDVWVKHYFSGSASNSNLAGYTRGNSITLICNSKTFLNGFTEYGANTQQVAMGFDGGGYSAGNVTADVMQNLELTKTITTKFDSGNMYSNLDDTKDVYVIKDGEKNKVESYGTVTCKNGLATHKYMKAYGYEGWNEGPITGRSRQSSGATADTMYCYRPKYSKVKAGVLASEPATATYGQSVLVTDGLPLVKCSDDGTLLFDMTFTTSTAGESDYIKFGFKKNTRFLNDQDDVKIQDGLDTNIETAVATHNKKISVEIKGLSKNDVIWIKAFPLTADSYATCKIENLGIKKN